jgi:hypothetical protein
MVDFHEIRQANHAIEGDLNTAIFSPIASTIPKWWTLKLLRWMQNLNQSKWEHDILYADKSSKDEQLLLRLLKDHHFRCYCLFFFLGLDSLIFNDVNDDEIIVCLLMKVINQDFYISGK